MPSPSRTDSFSPEKMQLFMAGLSGLPEEEVRKAKLLYLKNAVSEYEAAVEGMKLFGWVQFALALIPVFWPILWLQRRGMRIGRELMRERIENALEVWGDDLAGEHIYLPWPT